MVRQFIDSFYFKPVENGAKPRSLSIGQIESRIAYISNQIDYPLPTKTTIAHSCIPASSLNKKGLLLQFPIVLTQTKRFYFVKKYTEN